MSEIADFLLHGPRSAPELRRSLNISQATFSRLAAGQPQVIQFGKARATRYALSRPVRGTACFPLWRVNDEGRVGKVADLYPCWPQGSVLARYEDGDAQWFDGLPWYLTDLRPQGFLGRSWGRRVAALLNLPEDIRRWQEEEVLFALSAFDGESSGGWLVGEANYQRWLLVPPPLAIAQAEKALRYPEIAQEALAGEIIGSSAGGEQPKFTCFAQTARGDAHLLVKFSAVPETTVARRWADLLIAESLALGVLAGSGISTSGAQIVQSASGQVFLESTRFDCVGQAGRRAIVSLEAVQSEYAASPGGWPQVTRALVEQNIVTPDALHDVEKMWAFGRLIANSDMHAGNLSFFYGPPPLALAPVYDMLPMAFSPHTSGEMRREPVDIKFDPTPGRDAWSFALPLAEAFWRKVADDVRISDEFRGIAQGMAAPLDAVRQIIQRLA
ncbi:type II toxin-antitoxin system HipA family toxin YjjJ [Pluralibacter gergoviae]|uniref:type II toxin-antitoxin system HipA family toxin YjjJ n=1 Tax=Pluralibacter gergoviae TaxID=61647 RepID=UPI00190DD6E6|nr:type II toxin-antitoxin system HipA family toxin YjjJ [Pluralibacter gergoviae]MBK4116468.1 type II toxin-antitoxin system HipA family toxin YjjJ [Pluralibacter gergoviae]